MRQNFPLHRTLILKSFLSRLSSWVSDMIWNWQLLFTFIFSWKASCWKIDEKKFSHEWKFFFFSRWKIHLTTKLIRKCFATKLKQGSQSDVYYDELLIYEPKRSLIRSHFARKHATNFALFVSVRLKHSLATSSEKMINFLSSIWLMLLWQNPSLQFCNFLPRIFRNSHKFIADIQQVEQQNPFC